MSQTYSHQRITVLGLARSGVAAALALQAAGATVFGSDNGTVSDPNKKPLQESRIPFEENGHTEKALNADWAVLSPGIPLSAPPVVDLKRRGIPVIGEIELAYRLIQSRILAITGSNGKTTTTTLTGELLKEGGVPSTVGGNIGRPLCGCIGRVGTHAWVVAEISSFQLDSTDRFKPDTAVLLNLSPDHLDRYESEEAYYNAKLNLCRRQTGADRVVLNRDDPGLSRRLDRLPGKAERLFFSLERPVENGAWVKDGRLWLRFREREVPILPVEELGLMGIHNLSNALAAVCAAACAGVAPESMAPVLRRFRGLEHRMESVREIDQILFVNDSKATNVDSVEWALRSITGSIRLIAGGRDKQGDFSRLNELVRGKVAAVYLIGEAADKLARTWNGLTRLVRCGSMEEAVLQSRREARAGETVILSPGCASFDQYDNYQSRGKDFKRLVENV